ncbi:hypothetical protein JOQ06_003531 [Pogonophryne albipinna]|uniref:Uncharacterized protein n=1 Tax=Pogonophryne albipinna TaxID=1090488 RepID=A0AAD6AGY1_9TELE|nr:hypothetical protein JOQ06_003531 [Pogonophryne albipinna]
MAIQSTLIHETDSGERKTLGSGWGRLEIPVERRERARSAIANTRGGLANPSGLLMTAPLRNPTNYHLLLA